MKKPKPVISQKNKDEVKLLVNMMQKYRVVGLADMTNMPSVQLQKMRSTLKGNTEIYMTKGRLIRIALEKVKDKVKGADLLLPYVRGMPAFILTNDNPFKLASTLQKNKSAAPAKTGQIAPNDIIVPEGPTPFSPGPIIGELGAMGIKATIEGGKVVVKADKLLVKEGAEVTPAQASLLGRLGIEPMEIGINLTGVLEDGVIYEKSVLTVDEEEYLNNVRLAAAQAFNLSINIALPTKDNMKLLIQKAFRESEALADSQNILTSTNAERKLTQAEREAKALDAKLGDWDKAPKAAPKESGGGP